MLPTHICTHGNALVKKASHYPKMEWWERKDWELWLQSPQRLHCLPVVELFTLQEVRAATFSWCQYALCPCSLPCTLQCACRRAFAATRIERVHNEQQRWIIHHRLSKKEKWLLRFLPLSNSWVNLLTAAANVLQPNHSQKKAMVLFWGEVCSVAVSSYVNTACLTLEILHQAAAGHLHDQDPQQVKARGLWCKQSHGPSTPGNRWKDLN